MSVEDDFGAKNYRVESIVKMCLSVLYWMLERSNFKTFER